MQVHELPIAAVTKATMLGTWDHALNNLTLLEAPRGPAGLEPWCRQGWDPERGPLFPFEASRGCL